MKKVTEPAQWELELWVDCPYCEELQEIKWEEVPDYFERFELLRSQEGIEIKHTCDNEECGKEFLVDKTIW